MTKNTVSIELDRESLARLLGNHPVATESIVVMTTET